MRERHRRGFQHRNQKTAITERTLPWSAGLPVQLLFGNGRIPESPNSFQSCSNSPQVGVKLNCGGWGGMLWHDGVWVAKLMLGRKSPSLIQARLFGIWPVPSLQKHCSIDVVGGDESQGVDYKRFSA